ncbi:MAG TPA: hypothetical protein VF796_27170 [Humisphaera sp.]
MTDHPMTDPQPTAPVAARPAPPPPPSSAQPTRGPDHSLATGAATLFLAAMLFLAVLFGLAAVYLVVRYFPR